MHRIGELRRLRIVGRQLVVGRRLAVGAPDPLDRRRYRRRAPRRDDCRSRRRRRFRWPRASSSSAATRPNWRQIGAAGQRSALAELFDEFAVGGELQHHAVALAVAAEPDKALVVDQDGVLLQRPVVAEVVAGAAPRLHDVAGLVEHQHRRRRHAAFRARRIERCAFLVVGQRARPLKHPDVVLRVDGDAADLAEDPVVRQRLRPVRIDPERRALRAAERGDVNAPTAQQQPTASLLRASAPSFAAAVPTSSQCISGSAMAACLRENRNRSPRRPGRCARRTSRRSRAR